MNFKEIEHNSSDYWAAVDLRDAVLRKPLNLSFNKDELMAEDIQHHLAAFINEEVVGVLSMVFIEAELVKMRQVAVLPNLQGKGIGQKLVAFSEQWASNKGFKEIILHAREKSIPFYLKIDYKKLGEPFKEVNLVHYKMKKRLI